MRTHVHALVARRFPVHHSRCVLWRLPRLFCARTVLYFVCILSLTWRTSAASSRVQLDEALLCPTVCQCQRLAQLFYGCPCVMQEDGSGFMSSPKGVIVRQWDPTGAVTALCAPPAAEALDSTGVLDNGVFTLQLGDSMAVVYTILSRSLQIFTRADGVHLRFVQGYNSVSTAVVPPGCSLVGVPGQDTLARTDKGPKVAATHSERLSSIRAAVSGLK